MENNDTKYGRASLQKLKRKGGTVKRICKREQYYYYEFDGNLVG